MYLVINLSKPISKKQKQKQKQKLMNAKVYMERQKPRIANTILKDNYKVRGLKIPNFKTYYKSTAI